MYWICPVTGQGAMGTNWGTGSSVWTWGGTSSVWGWRSTGTGCPGMFWSLLLWRYSRPAWTRSCAAYCRWPCFGGEVGLDDPQRSLPTPTILWFCDSVLCLDLYAHLVINLSIRRATSIIYVFSFFVCFKLCPYSLHQKKLKNWITVHSVCFYGVLIYSVSAVSFSTCWALLYWSYFSITFGHLFCLSLHLFGMFLRRGREEQSRALYQKVQTYQRFM